MSECTTPENIMITGTCLTDTCCYVSLCMFDGTEMFHGCAVIKSAATLDGCAWVHFEHLLATEVRECVGVLP